LHIGNAPVFWCFIRIPGVLQTSNLRESTSTFFNLAYAVFQRR
jgi:hypothetical protein